MAKTVMDDLRQKLAKDPVDIAITVEEVAEIVKRLVNVEPRAYGYRKKIGKDAAKKISSLISDVVGILAHEVRKVYFSKNAAIARNRKTKTGFSWGYSHAKAEDRLAEIAYRRAMIHLTLAELGIESLLTPEDLEIITLHGDIEQPVPDDDEVFEEDELALEGEAKGRGGARGYHKVKNEDGYEVILTDFSTVFGEDDEEGGTEDDV